MHYLLAGLFAFAILTLWVPAVWPVAVFQVGIFTLCAVSLWRQRWARFPYPALALGFGVTWGVLQLALGWTAYGFDTQTATVRWATFLAVFLVGFHLFSDPEICRWFRSAMLWFAFAVSIWATLQTFTSEGKVFWLFPTGYTVHVMGPIIYHNHWAVFVEAVLPIALYEAFRGKQNALLYSVIAAVLFASIAASASRSGVAIAGVEIIVTAALVAVRRQRPAHTMSNAFVRTALLAAVFAALMGGTHLWDRFRDTDPMHGRREYSLSSLRMIQAHPFTGTGLGTWPTVYPHYALLDTGTFANQAHDDWLQFTVEGGVLFGAVVFSLFFWTLPLAFKHIWGIGVLAVFLHAFVDYPFSRPALGSWPILILAMLAAEQQRRAKNFEEAHEA